MYFSRIKMEVLSYNLIQNIVVNELVESRRLCAEKYCIKKFIKKFMAYPQFFFKKIDSNTNYNA